MASMPCLFFLFVMLLANEVTARENNSAIIKPGSSLSPKSNSPWLSASGLFAFGFYQQDNGFQVGIWLIGRDNNTVVWTVNRNNSAVSSDSILEFTRTGHLLLHTENGNQEQVDDLPKSATSASMLDSGNFVLYGENSEILWQSFDFPTDTILGGQNLTTGDMLVSSKSKSDHSSGYFLLGMQTDGNLVAYPVNSSLESEDSYWSSGVYGFDSQLTLNLTGFLYLGDSEDRPLKILANCTYLGLNTSSVYRATLDEDGNFRLYVHQVEKNIAGSVSLAWSALSNQCYVNGFCGFNSYCSGEECHCYPGFLPSRKNSNHNNDNMFLECEQNFTKDICETSADPVMLYDVSNMNGVSWSDVPYINLPLNMEACEKSCQEDCDCGAAIYDNDLCLKYKLPLRYGKRNENTSSMAIFKLPLENITNPVRPNPSPLKPKVLIDNKKSLILILVVTLGLVSFFGLVTAMSIFFIYRHQVHTYRKLSDSANLGFTEDCSVRAFSYDELVNSTGGFTEEVGRGTSGVVYKGTICGTNRRIAVKKLDRVVDEGEREFQAEITAIAQTHHRNLVQLIGFCIDGSRKLLVYEYMSNGSLADFLFKAKDLLPWKQRVRIALDVARGILYLHEECEVCIVHCNIKPQNILMDEAWTAKISDFGLARLLMPENSRAAIGNEVMSGYLAPEWQRDASVSVKADIYSYGVVLLEILCCRSNIDVNASSEEEILLSSWVYNCFVRGELNQLVADEDVEWRTMERMVKVGLWCVQDDPSLRPLMKNVILMLEGLKNIPIPPSPGPLI